MTTVTTQRSTENMAYVRRLLRQKQPGFSAALELALVLAELELWGPQRPTQTSATNTADGERVMVAARTRPQFVDLARTTRLSRTFAFLESLLPADFSTCGDLYTHRALIAALLTPWFSRRTVADLAAAFAGTSVSWARLHNLTSQSESRR